MILRHGQAIESIISHAVYLSEHAGTEVSDRFLLAVETTLERLERTPRMGRHWVDVHVPGVRVWRVKGFPSHLLFYRPLPNGVELLHLFHASQDIASFLATGREP